MGRAPLRLLFGALVGAAAACGTGQISVPDLALGFGASDGGVAAVDAATPRVERATGQRVVTGGATLEGLTSDGWVIFSEAGADGLTVAKAISIEGGDEIAIAKSNGSGKADLRIVVHGQVAFVWADRGNRMANLTIWSKASGVVPVGPGIRPARAAATVDGTHIAFMRDITDATASIVAGPIAGPYAVVGTMDATAACWQNADLATAGERLFALFCAPGSTAFSLRSAAPDGTASAELGTHVAGVAYGKTRVLWRETTGALRVAAPDGTEPATIATEGAAEAAMARGDSAVVFRTNDGAIKRAALDGGALEGLVAAGGAKLLGGVSTGGAHVLYASDVDDRGPDFVGPYADVKLAGGGADAGAGAALVTMKTSCPGCLSDSFSADGSLAVVLDPIDNTKAAGGVGVLRSFDVATGAPVASAGTRVYTAVALGPVGSRFLVVEATPDPVLVSGFSFGLKTQDLRAPSNATEVATGVEVVTVDATRAHAVYSFGLGSPLAGVWVAPL